MRVVKGPSRLEKFPIDGGGSDIVDGALVMIGATPGTNQGALIKATGAAQNAVGILVGIHDFSVVGDTTPENTNAQVFGEVEIISPDCSIAAEYDQTDTITAATGSSGTTLTTASLENNIDGGWIYVVSGDAAGQLHYITASASGSCTLGSTPSTAIGASDEYVKVYPAFFPTTLLGSSELGLKLNTNADKLGSDAANATTSGLQAKIWYNEIRYAGSKGWERLEPNKHDGLTGLNSKQCKIRAVFSLAHTFSNPLLL